MNRVEASPTGDLTFLVTAYGRPYTAAASAFAFESLCSVAPFSAAGGAPALTVRWGSPALQISLRTWGGEMHRRGAHVLVLPSMHGIEDGGGSRAPRQQHATEEVVKAWLCLCMPLTGLSKSA